MCHRHLVEQLDLCMSMTYACQERFLTTAQFLLDANVM